MNYMNIFLGGISHNCGKHTSEYHEHLIKLHDQSCVLSFFFLWPCSPTRDMASSFTRFLDHTHKDASQSVELLWTSDQSVAGTST